MPTPPLTLASASPRRRDLLRQAGIGFRVHAVPVEEHAREGERPDEFVLRIALAKARAARQSLPGPAPGAVLAADTVVVLDGEVLGKPRNRRDGLAMLARLSGRPHEVLTAVALLDGESENQRLSRSRVVFRELTREEREAYWHTGEGLDKAGSYAIQGRAAIFIERIEGSYSGIVGLPLCEVAELLRAAGLEPARCWHERR